MANRELTERERCTSMEHGQATPTAFDQAAQAKHASTQAERASPQAERISAQAERALAQIRQLDVDTAYLNVPIDRSRALRSPAPWYKLVSAQAERALA